MTDFVTVPKEPTKDMAQAGEWADVNAQGCLVTMRQAAVIYRAMIAAAPQGQPWDGRDRRHTEDAEGFVKP